MTFRPLALLALFATVVVTAPAAAPQNATKPVLEKGMDAAAIIRAYGRPDEVVPLKAADTKAEKWIYRRKVGETVHQTSNTQTFQLAMIGFGGDGKPAIAEVPVADYRLKYVAGFQVTALLMVDGKLQLGRQWFEREEKFAN